MANSSSGERILVTHAGSLPRPADLRAMVVAKSAGQPYDAAAFERRLAEAVAETVRLQAEHGIDIGARGQRQPRCQYARQDKPRMEPPFGWMSAHFALRCRRPCP